MLPVHIQPADQVPFSALVTALNRAYSDYYYPIYISAPSLRAMLARNDIAPADCAVALENDKVVGTGLLGVRGAFGWIGGMGVVPGHRRQGIGRRLLQYLIARARALGVQTLRLEVVEENRGAHTLYRQHGFQDVRHLHILERLPQHANPPDDAPPIIAAPPRTLLSHYEEFHAVRNCWQRALPSLRRLALYCQGWALSDVDAPLGYVLGNFTAQNVLVFDLATKADGPQGVAHAAALLAHLHHHYPHALGHAYNVAEDDPTLEAYHALGYQTHLRQIEMELALN